MGASRYSPSSALPKNVNRLIVSKWFRACLEGTFSKIARFQAKTKRRREDSKALLGLSKTRKTRSSRSWSSKGRHKLQGNIMIHMEVSILSFLPFKNSKNLV